MEVKKNVGETPLIRFFVPTRRRAKGKRNRVRNRALGSDGACLLSGFQSGAPVFAKPADALQGFTSKTVEAMLGRGTLRVTMPLANPKCE
ncbi:MAG TPA: hypothetical protein VF133_13045 [Terriglobales bacterium]